MCCVLFVLHAALGLLDDALLAVFLLLFFFELEEFFGGFADEGGDAVEVGAGHVTCIKKVYEV